MQRKSIQNTLNIMKLHKKIQKEQPSVGAETPQHVLKSTYFSFAGISVS